MSGILLGMDSSRLVTNSPSSEMKRKVEKVSRFIEEGCSLNGVGYK